MNTSDNTVPAGTTDNGPAWLDRMAGAGGRRLAPVAEPGATLGDLAPAMTLRVYGRGDDPLSLVLEWRDLPSQVTIATAARTLAAVATEAPLSSTIVTTG